MSLNRYGFLYQQYLQQNKPEEYKKMLENNTLIKIITKKQDQILEYRNSLYKKVANDKLFDKKKYKNEEEYELAIKEYIENQINNKLIEFFQEDVLRFT